MALFPIEDPESGDRMRSLLGPGHVDQQIRQAIHIAWMTLPEAKKTVAEVDRVIRQIVDRALKDFREDGETFGQGG